MPQVPSAAAGSSGTSTTPFLELLKDPHVRGELNKLIDETLANNNVVKKSDKKTLKRKRGRPGAVVILAAGKKDQQDLITEAEDLRWKVGLLQEFLG
jgi:hypothetical protein